MERVERNKRLRDTERESPSSDCESAKGKRSKSNKTPINRVGGSVTKKLRLRVTSRLPPSIYAGGIIENEQGGKILVELLDCSTGEVVKNGPASCATLNLVVLEGGFKKDDEESWTREEFASYLVTERDGKGPLLIGDTKVKLTQGVGQLGDVSFSDNSSWIRSKEFRLGLQVASSCDGDNRIREAKTEAFAVKDQRGEAYKKHFPPKSKDPVWRLRGIGRNGEFHRRLTKAEIHTVEDVRRLIARDSEKFRELLGGKSGRRWKELIDHAKMCEPNEKRYIYSPKDGNGMNIICNNLADVIGVSDGGGSYIPFKNLDEENKLSVTKLAYENWDSVQEMSNSGNQYPVIAPQQFFDSNANQIGSTCIHAMPSRNGALLGYNKEIIIEEPNRGNLCPTAHHQFPDFKEDQIGSTSKPILEGQALGDHDVESVIEMSSPGHSYMPAHKQFLNIYGNQIESTRVPVAGQEQTTDWNGTLLDCNIWESSNIENLWNFDVTEYLSTLEGLLREPSSKKARLAWLKVKAVLKWGTFQKNRVARKRARLSELPQEPNNEACV